MNERQAVCDALARMRADGAAWITLGGQRFKVVVADSEAEDGDGAVRSGDLVLLATRRGYEVAFVSRRKGPHVGVPRWHADVPGGPHFWTSAKAIRAKVIESHARKS